jgi:beta-xylosidase
MLSPTLLRRGTSALTIVAAFFACDGEPSTSSSLGPSEPPSPPVLTASRPAVGFSHYPNPVRPEDFPDPFVFVTDTAYYAYATNVGASNVPMLRSLDLVHWDPAGDAMPLLAAWAEAGESHTWAPAVLKLDNRYLLFYTARDRGSNLQCIGRAESSDLTGPFIDRSITPFICQVALGGSIDASVVRDSLRQTYVLWKNDGNCCGKSVTLWSQQLSPDGRALLGRPTPLLVRDQRWEGSLIEAPSMWEEHGVWHLLYSANSWNTDRYAVGYARCDSPTGPCYKIGSAPVMATDQETAGPGGAEVFRDRAGRSWVAYHGWSAPLVGYRRGGVRSFRLDRIELTEDETAIR